jgi:hypothetical protein
VNKLISIFNCTSHLNPCTFGIPEGNARTITSYSLVYHFLANREDTYFQCPSRGMDEVMGGGGGGGGGGGHLDFYINVEIKQSAI